MSNESHRFKKSLSENRKQAVGQIGACRVVQAGQIQNITNRAKVGLPATETSKAKARIHGQNTKNVSKLFRKFSTTVL